jgi:HlyD family secretion protein
VSTAYRVTLVALVLLAACGGDEPDAYGNFEAEEVVVAAEGAGDLVRFDPDEGDRLAAGETVGQIDTTALALRRAELGSQQGSTEIRVREAEQQIDVLRAQLATARDEHQRTLRLYRAEAATAQQLNRAEGEVRVLTERIEAATAQTSMARQETGTAGTRVQQLEEEILKRRIVNPSAGTVLVTYVEPGEFVQPGQPLYRIADLGTLILRAYVSGADLGRLRLGAAAQVRVDAGADALRTLPGTITWIASEAEFTPTPIQTREERTDQVYAVRVRVPNPDGSLKIGMPGELVLSR